MANTFYQAYLKNYGAISKAAFNMFWEGRHKVVCEIYEDLVRKIGTISEIGLHDLLVYNHSAYCCGEYLLEGHALPQPPTKSELIAIYNYEVSQEEKYVKGVEGTFLTQPFILNKAILASKIGITNGCTIAIETGTFLGLSSYIFSGIFTNTLTIEADSELYASSNKWLTDKVHNIECFNGNSAVVLPELLLRINSKALLFLDAHYSTGITSSVYGICPLIEELKIVFSRRNDVIVVIDDFGCMGLKGYPTVSEILGMIPLGKTIVISHDQMIIS
jgi:hypothetical protein